MNTLHYVVVRLLYAYKLLVESVSRVVLLVCIKDSCKLFCFAILNVKRSGAALIVAILCLLGMASFYYTCCPC